MGLFDKKNCDFCGRKIGLLGNKKLADGNMCKDCAAKLSPWFSERRHSSREDILRQLTYREENKKAVADFHVTRSIGRYTKLLLDEDARRFMVSAASDLAAANPDVLDYAQVTGCDLKVEESRNELKTKDSEGKLVSYDPPRYEYSYNFRVCIQVNHPYFDDIDYSLSNGYVKTGERMTSAAPSGWRVKQNHFSSTKVNAYLEYMDMGNQLRDAIMEMRQEARAEAAAQNAPKTAVTCPNCGGSTIPDDNGRCEYCGSAVWA